MIKRVLICLYSVVHTGYLNLCWFLQFQICKNTQKSSISGSKDVSSLPFKHALYLVPHADDDLISGWSFLKRNRERISLFYCGFTGSRTDEKNRKIRRNEFVQYCTKNDFYFIESNGNYAKEIDQILKTKQYDAVFLPCYLDWHKEHRQLDEMLEKIDLNNLQIIWYSVTVPLTAQVNNACSPMTEQEQKEKWIQFKQTYRSQCMPIMRLKYQERLTGMQLGYFAVESFYIFPDTEAFLCLMNKFHKINEVTPFDCLSEKINNLSKIRQFVAEKFVLDFDHAISK